MGKEVDETMIGKIDDCDSEVRKTAQEMDIIRQRTVAYEYLCRLEEAKTWMEACIKEELPHAVDFEESLRNGVYLAKLGHFISPELLPLNKIYDIDLRRYKVVGLQFKHTDNINKFLQVLKMTELPATFQPETTDIYDKKNMPRVIYCLHALSSHLFKLGKAPIIHDVFGKVVFTDEQLDLVTKDLQKCEHPLPMFQKIGGILSKKIVDNDANLHHAIEELNYLLDTEDSITFAILNPALKLKHVQNRLIDEYKKVLRSAKYEKKQVALNRSLNDSYVPDEYDEMLTLVEIQGHITATNYKFLWKSLCAACNNNDVGSLHKIFKENWVKLRNYQPDNIDFYCDVVKDILETSKDNDVESITNWHKIFQSIINEGNKTALEHNDHKTAIININRALDVGTPDDLYAALVNPKLHLNFTIDKFAIPLIFEEMRLEKCELERSLNENEIAASITYLSSVASISQAVQRGDERALWNALNSKQLHLDTLRSHCRRRYLTALVTALDVKFKEQCECPLLTLDDIRDTIEMVNMKDNDEEDLVMVVDNINKAVSIEDVDTLISLLKSPCLKIATNFHKEEYHLYLRILKKKLLSKETQNLWLDDIIETVEEVSNESTRAKELTDALIQLNLSILKNNIKEFWLALSCPVLCNSQIMEPSCRDVYFYTFSKALKKKGQNICSWIVCHTEAGNTLYIDIESYTYVWTTPKGFMPYARYLTKKDVRVLIEKTNKHHVNTYKQKLLEVCITKFQGYCRGYLLRQAIEREIFLRSNVHNIIRIQTWWRRILAQRKFGTLIKMKAIEAKLKRERKLNPLAWYKVQEQKIIKIQALWRGRRARQAFTSLFYSANPPLKVVKKFIPILDFATEDYDREIELQTLKSAVVQSIRKNQELSKQIDDMDLKIGLLVQNRIALQEVAAHGLKLNNLVKHNSMTKLVFHNRNESKSLLTISTAVKGLKSLTKESKRLLDGYQHLFYELQTNPTYLSKLLFCIPQNKTNFFLQNVVLCLYNYGAYARDEYLLLKLFRFTLEEEISCKVTKPFDIISSTPLVLKMAVSLSRQLSGLNSLQIIIGPLVEKILRDKELNIETGPVEIYKAWRNETEMKTGQISNLPYNVTQDEALNYSEVKSRLQVALAQLKTVVTMFLEQITNSTELLPFCITYMARVLHRALSSKFPHTPEKDILKVIGNLVYYQFLNAAIVAPDAFHIINVPNGLTTDQRKNLASVAKILHFASAKKGFGEESSHLRCLNPFIVECHEKMKELFRRCCRGPTLEEYFAVDEYTEATLLHRPHIYITVQEIVDTHALLVEYQDIIAPDPNDRLNELLDDLGEVPSVAKLASRDLDVQIGDSEENSRLEVCLALVNKFQTPRDDMTDVNKLFIKTKELCVAIIPFLNGEHLLEALVIGTTKEQQEQYSEQVQKRIYSGQARPDEAMSLREHIAKLRRNLQMLEDEGYVTREDGYQALITSIALDLCNKGKYRQAQKRALTTLTRTKQSLQEKTKYYQEKCKSYDEYIKSCLANLHAGKKSVHACLRRSGKDIQKLKSKLTVKYSGAKLLERGVLLEIEGLSPSQFKNVQFEITPTDHNGVFTVKGKFMGVEMEKIEIDIQDLLQKQYEGCAIMDMFGKAKINVNLLIFLLNSKFYGKS